jgi:hypothetical protein
MFKNSIIVVYVIRWLAAVKPAQAPPSMIMPITTQLLSVQTTEYCSGQLPALHSYIACNSSK